MSFHRRFLDDPDLAERLRQFIVVCKVAFRIRRGATVGGKQAGLENIAKNEFGLSDTYYLSGVGRARNLVDEIEALP